GQGREAARLPQAAQGAQRADRGGERLARALGARVRETCSEGGLSGQRHLCRSDFEARSAERAELEEAPRRSRSKAGHRWSVWTALRRYGAWSGAAHQARA